MLELYRDALCQLQAVPIADFKGLGEPDHPVREFFEQLDELF